MSTARAKDIACQEVVDLLTGFLEGALDPETGARIEQHLVLCPDCTEYLRQFRLTIAATGRLSETALPDRVVDELLQVFRRWRDGRRS
jgi:anti-sigma factor RsiW